MIASSCSPISSRSLSRTAEVREDLTPGQVLAEIGGEPKDIEEIEGRFLGLMLFTAAGLEQLAKRLGALPPEERRVADFTRLLSSLIEAGVRVDTAANILPWMEVDSAKDLGIALRIPS